MKKKHKQCISFIGSSVLYSKQSLFGREIIMKGLTIKEVALTNTEPEITNKGIMVEAELTTNKETEWFNKKKRTKEFC
jgi:hypothetical protein